MVVAEDPLLPTSEVMELLRLTRWSVIDWVERGYLKDIRLPSGQRRIRLSEVERILRGEKAAPERHYGPKA